MEDEGRDYRKVFPLHEEDAGVFETAGKPASEEDRDEHSNQVLSLIKKALNDLSKWREELPDEVLRALGVLAKAVDYGESYYASATKDQSEDIVVTLDDEELNTTLGSLSKGIALLLRRARKSTKTKATAEEAASTEESVEGDTTEDSTEDSSEVSLADEINAILEASAVEDSEVEDSDDADAEESTEETTDESSSDEDDNDQETGTPMGTDNQETEVEDDGAMMVPEGTAKKLSEVISAAVREVIEEGM